MVIIGQLLAVYRTSAWRFVFLFPSTRPTLTSAATFLFLLYASCACVALPLQSASHSSTAHLSAARSSTTQSSASHPSASHSSPRQAAGAASTPAAAELQRRIAAAHAAQQTGDPEAIATASRQVIGLSLRQMAGLRVLEAAFPQALELYRRSLDFEDTPDARVDLAVAYLRSKNADAAISEAVNALMVAPDNARAWNLQGKAWMMKKDYRHAAESLSRSIELQADVEAAYSLAICLLTLHEKEKAASVFQEMVKSRENSGPIHVLFARAYRDADYLDDARQELDQSLKIDPKTSHAHYFLGLLRMREDEWAPSPEARQQFLSEVALSPRDFLSNYMLGVMATNTKQYAEANRFLNIAAEVNPLWPEPWLYLGLNAYSQSDFKKAEAMFRKSIALTGNDESRNNYQLRKAYVALGHILNDSNRKEEAAKALQKAREMQKLSLREARQSVSAIESPERSQQASTTEPADSYLPAAAEESSLPKFATGDSAARLDADSMNRAHLNDTEKQLALTQEKQLHVVLGGSLNDLGTSEARRQQYSLALAHFHEAERWDPEFPGLLRNIGIAAVRVENYKEAIRALSQVVAANGKDNPARAMLGMSLYMTEDYAKAAKTIGPLGNTVMSDLGLAYAWAVSLTKISQLEEARRVLDRIEQQPLSTGMLLLVGQSWSDAGDHLHAVKTLHKALSQDASLKKAHLYAGLAYLRADRPSDAGDEFKAELTLSPEDPEATYNLGLAYLLQAQREKALGLFQSVASAHPEHANAQYQIGKMLLDEDKVSEAIPHLETAARLGPERDYVHYQLQAAYRKESRLQDADRELKLYREIKALNRKTSTPHPEESR